MTEQAFVTFEPTDRFIVDSIVTDYDAYPIDHYELSLYIRLAAIGAERNGMVEGLSLTDLEKRIRMSRPKIISGLARLAEVGLIYIHSEGTHTSNEVNAYQIRRLQWVVNEINHPENGGKPHLPVVNDVNGKESLMDTYESVMNESQSSAQKILRDEGDESQAETPTDDLFQVAKAPNPKLRRAPSPAPKEKKPRARDLVWDALAAQIFSGVEGASGRIPRVKKALLAAYPDEATPENIEDFAKWWRRTHKPDVSVPMGADTLPINFGLWLKNVHSKTIKTDTATSIDNRWKNTPPPDVKLFSPKHGIFIGTVSQMEYKAKLRGISYEQQVEMAGAEADIAREQNDQNAERYLNANRNA